MNVVERCELRSERGRLRGNGVGIAAQSFDDANEIGILAARRHEIDQAHRTADGLNFGFEN